MKATVRQLLPQSAMILTLGSTALRRKSKWINPYLERKNRHSSVLDPDRVCSRIAGGDRTAMPDHARREFSPPDCRHCKPWRDSTNEKRLDGENGLLLTPTIDHLFDRGFIGFEDSGQLIISPVAHRPSLNGMGIETERPVNVGGFTEANADVHRNSVLLRANR
jgi:hypothetical protein